MRVDVENMMRILNVNGKFLNNSILEKKLKQLWIMLMNQRKWFTTFQIIQDRFKEKFKVDVKIAIHKKKSLHYL